MKSLNKLLVVAIAALTLASCAHKETAPAETVAPEINAEVAKFSCANAPKKAVTAQDKACKKFNRLDKNLDGSIDLKSEVKGKKAKHLAKFDKDGNGSIDIQEFMNLQDSDVKGQKSFGN